MDENAEKSGLFVPPGHFYSPLVEPRSLKKIRYRSVLASEFTFDSDSQWTELETCLQRLNNSTKELSDSSATYYRFNDQFSLSDARIYMGILAKHTPLRIVEVGSGWTTAIAVDYRISNGLDLSITVFEPFPERLLSIGMPEDSFTIRESNIIDLTDFSDFEGLKRGDILFIDSSHVVKTGSELLTIMFEIIPRLNSGVLIHFHDIFDCFDYPVSWIMDEKRSWNEAYFLRALLQGNTDLKVLLMGDHLRNLDFERFSNAVNSEDASGSLWIQKC